MVEILDPTIQKSKMVGISDLKIKKRWWGFRV